MMRRVLTGVWLALAATLMQGQTMPAVVEGVKVGAAAPVMVAGALEEKRGFAGWESLRGQVVVVDFWATWCAPCLPGLAKMAAMEKTFAGQPVRFVTVALDERERVKTYLAEKGIDLQTFVDDAGRTQARAWGVRAISTTAIVDGQGKVVAVTSGENVTEEVVRKVLKGEKVTLAAPARENNLSWDVEEVEWKDGVEPLYQVVIKPIETSGGGFLYKPGSNRISGDGTPVIGMVMAAWQTDTLHMEVRAKLAAGTYRFAAVVPVGREKELLPSLQEALQRTFGFKAHWEDMEREVLVMTRDGAGLKESVAEQGEVSFARGKITMKKQTMGELAEKLPSWVKKPVVDETGAKGAYDFDLEYRADGDAILRQGLKEKYGLVLTPGRRKVRVLIVEAGGG